MKYPIIPLVFFITGIEISLLTRADTHDEVTNSVEVEQTLEINSPENPTTATNGVAFVDITWIVTSNNAFRISFTGTSFTDAGAAIDQPRFTKQDLDAYGQPYTTYDSLTTTFGIVILGYDSVEFSNTWGNGATATGSPEHIVKPLGENNSPDQTIGAIMPDYNAGTATVSLTSKGVSSLGNQSGNYTLTITIIATPDEQP